MCGRVSHICTSALKRGLHDNTHTHISENIHMQKMPHPHKCMHVYVRAHGGAVY